MADYAALQLDTRLRSLVSTQMPTVSACPSGEVLIRVAYAGICHTDLAILQGDFQINCDQLVLGHEISGIVSGIGDGVKGLHVGDKVAVNPNSRCERCAVCFHEEAGGPAEAGVGVARNGGWAEFCLVPQSQLHLLPPEVSLEQGVLCESLSCVAHAWEHVTPLPHSARVVVLGMDIVGCLTASLLHVQGYRHVTLCEDGESARQRCNNLGLGYEMITHHDLCNKTFDLAIDCTGDAMIQQEAASSLGFGGQLLIFRSTSMKDRICLSPFDIFINEIKVTGSLINPYAFGKALTWATVLGYRYLNFDKLGVVSYPLKEYRKALETAKTDDVAKVVFKFDISAVPTP